MAVPNTTASDPITIAMKPALIADVAGRPVEVDRGVRLVSAAYDLLAEEGLEGLTVRAVLARTGLARRAFYDRFGGKDDLVLAVFEQTLRLAANHFREQASLRESPVEGLREIVTGIIMGPLSYAAEDVEAGDRRSAALAHEHLRLAESHPAELQAALSPLVDLIALHISRGMAEGQFRDCDPVLAARLVYNLVSTTVHTALLSAQGLSPDVARRRQLAADIWEFCHRALAA